MDSKSPQETLAREKAALELHQLELETEHLRLETRKLEMETAAIRRSHALYPLKVIGLLILAIAMAVLVFAR